MTNRSTRHIPEPGILPETVRVDAFVFQRRQHRSSPRHLPLKDQPCAETGQWAAAMVAE